MTKRVSVLIDKLTNSIELAGSGEIVQTDVLAVDNDDLKGITKKNGWNFNWKLEYKRSAQVQLIKLVAKTEPGIVQGLASYEKREGYYYLHLIESAPFNIGKKKKYVGIPGNIVAFVCRLSFREGFDGFVSFTPKTKLIDHYNEQLGAVMISKTDMAIYPESAKKLVNSYYKNEW